MTLSPDGIAPFLFTLIATLGLVPIFRRLASALGNITGRFPILIPVIKVLRHGGVAMACGTALTLFYVPASGPYPATLGLACFLILLAACISYAGAWQRIPRLGRTLTKLSLLALLVGGLLIPVLFQPPYDRPLMLLAAACVFFLVSYSPMGIRSDRRDPLAAGYVAIIIMLSILVMSTMRPDRLQSNGTFLLEIQEVGRAGAGALLACLFYSIRTSWRTSPAMRIGLDGHLIIGLFIVWSSLMMLAHFANWGTLAAALCWVMAAPIFWFAHYLLSVRWRGLLMPGPNETILIVAVTLITCLVGIVVVALRFHWQPVLFALFPAFIAYLAVANWVARRHAPEAGEGEADGKQVFGLGQPGASIRPR